MVGRYPIFIFINEFLNIKSFQINNKKYYFIYLKAKYCELSNSCYRPSVVFGTNFNLSESFLRPLLI